MFIFVTCQVGAEGALKKELARDYADLKLAFSRPGFVTFKREDFDAKYEIKSVFARAYGISLGKFGVDFEKIRELAHETWKKYAPEQKSLKVHLWERDQFAPDEAPLGYEWGKWIAPARVEFDGFSKDEPALGELVFDAVAVEEKEFWAGFHFHSPSHSRSAGGIARIEIPSDSPSRAYLKLEEALSWSRAPIRSGDTAVEIGSAPGGASDALLRRGLQIVGIDPAEMDPRILKNPKFQHIQRPVASVLREELPREVQWLLLDMNVEPRITLFQVDRLATRLRDSLLGVMLTIKLNRWEIADEIPQMLEHLKAMGMVKLRVAQLSTFKREIFVYGLTRKGLQR